MVIEKLEQERDKREAMDRASKNSKWIQRRNWGEAGKKLRRSSGVAEEKPRRSWGVAEETPEGN